MKRTTPPTNYEEKVELLFDKTVRGSDELRSSLTLLREEVRINFTHNATWSGVMCIMAGIDLVGKFYSDNDNKKGVGIRFKKYLEDIVALTPREANLVYQARNAFIHSFGLFSEETIKNDGNKKYFIHPRFDPTGKHWKFVVRETWSDGVAEHFELGIYPLFIQFEKSLAKLKKHLLVHRPQNFPELFDKYGTDKPLFENLNFYDYCNINKLSSRFK